MGRFVKDSRVVSSEVFAVNVVASTVAAETITANNSPVLTTQNSTFDYTVYVSKNGDDANDGRSLATPKLTIKSAFATADTLSSAGVYKVAVKVASGTYVEDNPIIQPKNVSLIGDSIRSVTVEPANPNSDFFLMNAGTYVWGITVRAYAANCWSYDPTATTVFVSPYIQNITSSTTSANATCVFIDGNISSSVSTKAMILGFMTIINQGGVGVKLINQAYSQAVNIYTIFCDVGIKLETGSFMTLNGSDCSAGNYGIWADGKTPLYYGNVTSANVLGGDSTVTVGNLTSFPRTNNGLIFEGDPEIYFISTFSNLGGNVWNINVTSRFGNNYPLGTNVTGYAVSTVSASAHTMEYVGAGTNPATALPQYGGIPKPENEIIQTGDGRVNFTSTDQKGDFRIGTGLTVVRATGTIEGDDFNRSLFAVLTPYILSIEG